MTRLVTQHAPRKQANQAGEQRVMTQEGTMVTLRVTFRGSQPESSMGLRVASCVL